MNPKESTASPAGAEEDFEGLLKFESCTAEEKSPEKECENGERNFNRKDSSLFFMSIIL